MALVRPRLFRPRLAIPAQAGEEQVLAAIDRLLATDACSGSRTGTHVSMTVPKRERRFWSPWLHLEYTLEAGPESGELAGWAGPAPSIWTAFAMGHLGLLTLALGAGMWWFAARLAGEPGFAGWVAVGALGCSAVLAVAGLIGRRKASEQQQRLVDLLTGALR